MISNSILDLVLYGEKNGLIAKEDKNFAINRLLEIMEEPSFAPTESAKERPLEDILSDLLEDASAKNLIDGESITQRDLFDTKLMGALMPRPSEVIRNFWEKYNTSAEDATDYYYKLSQDSDYIRRYRICKDVRWVSDTPYGALDITINLSKPEKDPRAIAAAKNAPQGEVYPKCALCPENEGYAGRMNAAARQNHRIIPLTLQGEAWNLQYSPYVYYNEHCIVFNNLHTPMKISKESFAKLFDFVSLFPHYFVGSNADLPIVGGSILTHDHFQGGHYTFAMEKAPIEIPVSFKGFEDVTGGIVYWPLSVIRLRHADAAKLAELAGIILEKWRNYTDEDAFVFAQTDGVPHNTITPIVRRKGEDYEIDLVLRNNITTEEHPLGVYHPHAELHHIKKENIGLIEVMGLAVLPARLQTELSVLGEALVAGKDPAEDEMIAKHADWANEIRNKYGVITKENVDDILKKETGIVFSKVLEHAGVYKCTEDGRAAFLRFIASV